MNRNRLILVVGKTTSAPPATTSTAAASSSLAGIPQHADTLGQPGAPATLIVYEDPQCPSNAGRPILDSSMSRASMGCIVALRGGKSCANGNVSLHITNRSSG